jgi:hypothetical protein
MVLYLSMEFDCGMRAALRRAGALTNLADPGAHPLPRRSPAAAPDRVHSCVVSPARIQPQQPQNDVINQAASACAETLSTPARGDAKKA